MHMKEKKKYLAFPSKFVDQLSVNWTNFDGIDQNHSRWSTRSSGECKRKYNNISVYYVCLRQTNICVKTNMKRWIIDQLIIISSSYTPYTPHRSIFLSLAWASWLFPTILHTFSQQIYVIFFLLLSFNSSFRMCNWLLLM